jgi:hypothetical protein
MGKLLGMFAIQLICWCECGAVCCLALSGRINGLVIGVGAVAGGGRMYGMVIGGGAVAGGGIVGFVSPDAGQVVWLAVMPSGRQFSHPICDRLVTCYMAYMARCGISWCI